MRHANPLGWYQPHRVGMMLECSTGESLARAAFMHHDDQGDDALMNHAPQLFITVFWGYTLLEDEL